MIELGVYDSFVENMMERDTTVQEGKQAGVWD